MKKNKLISSLCIAGLISINAPIVTTSCSNNTKLEIILNTNEVGINDKVIFAYLKYENNDFDYIKDINVTSSNKNVLEIKQTHASAYGIGVIDIKCKQLGAITLTVEVSDYNGCTTKNEFIVNIVEFTKKINISSEGNNYKYSDGVVTITDSSLTTIIDLSIKGEVGATFSIKESVTGISIDGSSLKIDSNTIYYETPNTITIQSDSANDLIINLTASAPKIKASSKMAGEHLPSDVNVPNNKAFGVSTGDIISFNVTNTATSITYICDTSGKTGTYTFDATARTLTVDDKPSATDTITVIATYDNSKTTRFTLVLIQLNSYIYEESDLTLNNCTITSSEDPSTFFAEITDETKESTITFAKKTTDECSWLVSYRDLSEWYIVQEEYQSSGNLQYVKFSDGTLTTAPGFSQVGIIIVCCRTATTFYFISLWF